MCFLCKAVINFALIGIIVVSCILSGSSALKLWQIAILMTTCTEINVDIIRSQDMNQKIEEQEKPCAEPQTVVLYATDVFLLYLTASNAG